MRLPSLFGVTVLVVLAAAPADLERKGRWGWHPADPADLVGPAVRPQLRLVRGARGGALAMGQAASLHDARLMSADLARLAAQISA